MSDETTSEQLAEIEGQAEPVQVREGRWRTRGGSIRNVTPTPQDHESFPAAYLWWDGFDTWRNDGRWWAAQETTSDLVEYLGPIEPDKTQELPTKTQELPEYTPPEGWRVLAVGEALREGDVTVRADGYQYPTERVGSVVGAKQRYIRPIESQAEPEPPDGWQLVPLGEPLKGGDEYHAGLDRYIRRIEPQPQPEPEPNVAAIEELRSEVSYVQRLLGESRQRVTQLEELVASLRTINETQEKAFTAAGKENTVLRNQLAAVKAELVQERLERNRWHNQVLRVTAELDEKTTQCEILQIELDAAQQVPADSPEIRQLRADLEQVTQDRDTYRHAHELLVRDIDATHQRTKAMTVEAIAEWLVPVQAAIAAADNVAESTRAGWLAEEVIQHLPTIMRSLTGLDGPEDVD